MIVIARKEVYEYENIKLQERSKNIQVKIEDRKETKLSEKDKRESAFDTANERLAE